MGSRALRPTTARRPVAAAAVAMVVALATGCGEEVVGAGPPAGPPSITGTLTSVTPFVPRTEDCVEVGRRPPDAAVSSDDEPFCTDPDSDVVGSVLVEEQPDRPVAGSRPPQGDKAVVTVDTGSQILRQAGGGYAEAAFDAFEVGQVVDVWFSGPVAESYPVQAGAKAVVISEPAG
ncbi:MAG: YobA family protein [Actinobacteria bacterium]|nr:YobA family protein [Actinomycetota bacterium]